MAFAICRVRCPASLASAVLAVLTLAAPACEGGGSPTGFPLLRTVLLDYSLVTPACLLVLNGTVPALWTDRWGRRVYRAVW